MIVPLEHLSAGPIRVLGTPLKLSATPASIRTPPPALGQHTDAILHEVGLSDSEIAGLRDAGAVR
jgi:crotonobetainyl-CoA:carnitine CoA-transferase CaiB-like acyl-CoA transferase